MRSTRTARHASVAALAALVFSAFQAGAARADEPVAPSPPADSPAAAPAPLPPPALPPPAPPEAAGPPAVVIVEAPPPVVAPPAAEAAEARPRDDGPDEARFRDAHADRVIMGPTAETHPKGTFFVTDYEVALLQLGYAVTDDLQLSIAGVPPIAKDQPLFFDFGAKLNLARTESTRIAVYGALDVLTNPGGSSGDNAPAVAGRVGGVAQICFERTCRSSVSFGGGAIFAKDVKAVPVYGAVGFIANVSPLVSLLAEPNVLALTSGDGASGGALFSLGYGIRLSGKNFGVDLTFIEPLAMTNGNFENPFVLGYPFVAFTYRTDPSPRAASGAAARTAPTTPPIVARGM